MIGSIAGWLLARNLIGSLPAAQRAAKVLLLLAGLVLLLLAAGIGIALIRRDAVRDFATEQRAQDTEAALTGERRANRADAERNIARESASEQTEAELETIHAEDPEAAAAAAPRGSRAVAGRLRHP